MLTAQLEERFRGALGERGLVESDDSLRFAVDFVRLLSRILPHEVSPAARDAMLLAVPR